MSTTMFEVRDTKTGEVIGEAKTFGEGGHAEYGIEVDLDPDRRYGLSDQKRTNLIKFWDYDYEPDEMVSRMFGCDAKLVATRQIDGLVVDKQGHLRSRVIKRYDDNGLDSDGYDWMGYDADGYDTQGHSKYDEEFEWGKDLLGNDVRHYEVDKDERGFYPDGVHENGTPYDDNGLDAWGEDKYGLTPESDEVDILGARSIYDAVCRDIEQASESERAARAEEYRRADQARRELTERADRWCQDHLGRDGYTIDEKDGILRDSEGYDEDGLDSRGYDRNGRDIDGWTEDGYRRDAEGIDRDAGGYDRDGYDEDGYDIDGFDRDGYDNEGYDEQGYDADGYDRDGFDEHGYDRGGNYEDDVIAVSFSDVQPKKPGLFDRIRSGLGNLASDISEANAQAKGPANPFGGDSSVSGGQGHEGKPMVAGYEYTNKNGKRVHVDSYKNPKYKGPRR